MPQELSNSEFAKFLSDKPLYAKIKAVTVEGYIGLKYHHASDLHNKAFKFICPVEKEVQTFKTQYPHGAHQFMLRTIENDDLTQVPDFFDEISGMLEQTSEIIGCCQSCGATLSFLIRRFSDKPWSEVKEGLSIYLQKIGQYPAYDIRPDKEIQKYLSDDDLELFKKGLVCLSSSYGVGAFAYFRRVVENEIKRIVKDISQLEFDGVLKVREAYQTFEQNHQMANLIAVAIEYLPTSLKIGSENPLGLIYQQLSVGLHNLPEEECLDRADSINTLFTFFIKKINEEKFASTDVAEAIKKLRKY